MVVRESFVAVVDAVLIGAGVLLVGLLIRSVVVSLRRGYVYINRQQATRADAPLGFWLVIASWIVLSILFSFVVVKGMMDQ